MAAADAGRYGRFFLQPICSCRYLVQFDVFVCVANYREIVLEVVSRDDYRATAVVRVEGKRLCLLQVSVKKQMYMMFGVVDESEGRNAARFQAQILHHALRRSERQLAARRQTLAYKRLLQQMLQVVNCEIVVAVEAYEIMAVALMVAEEEVLAVNAAVVLPPAFSLLDCFALWVIIASEWDVVFFKVVENLFLSFGYLFHCI